MSVGAIVILVIAIVILGALASALLLRSLGLRHQFGPEYERLAHELGPRRARAELAERQHRVDHLGLRPLSAEKHATYSGEWTAAQERFVDSPAEATEAAAALVTAVATDRGYQVDNRAQLLKDLSVHHSQRLDGYRRANEATERAATAPTEELRQALLAHRALFRELLGTQGRAPARALAPTSANTTVTGGPGRALPVGATTSKDTQTSRLRVRRPADSRPTAAATTKE